MGKEAFFQGVSKYLKAHMYQNARTDDLWNSLGQVNLLRKLTQIVTFFHDIQFHLILFTLAYLVQKMLQINRKITIAQSFKTGMTFKKVQVGNDQEMAQSERSSHSIISENRQPFRITKVHVNNYFVRVYLRKIQNKCHVIG